MFCIKCGEPLKEGAAFCHACGERVDGQKTETTRSEGHKQKNPTKKVIAVAVLLAVAIVGIKIAGSIGNSSGGPASTPRGNQQSERLERGPTVQCSPCNGVGHTRCGDCSGTGYRLGEWSRAAGESTKHTCVTCSGSGVRTCNYCSGTGWR